MNLGGHNLQLRLLVVVLTVTLRVLEYLNLLFLILFITEAILAFRNMMTCITSGRWIWVWIIWYDSCLQDFKGPCMSSNLQV
jgi:hypothetical protein